MDGAAIFSPPNTAQFRFWLLKSKPGDVFVYHVGNLAQDRDYWEVRDVGGGVNQLRLVGHIEPLHSLAGDVLNASDQGWVLLVQRRLGPNYFQYEARRIGRRS